MAYVYPNTNILIQGKRPQKSWKMLNLLTYGWGVGGLYQLGELGQEVSSERRHKKLIFAYNLRSDRTEDTVQVLQGTEL